MRTAAEVAIEYAAERRRKEREEQAELAAACQQRDAREAELQGFIRDALMSLAEIPDLDVSLKEQTIRLPDGGYTIQLYTANATENGVPGAGPRGIYWKYNISTYGGAWSAEDLNTGLGALVSQYL